MTILSVKTGGTKLAVLQISLTIKLVKMIEFGSCFSDKGQLFMILICTYMRSMYMYITEEMQVWGVRTPPFEHIMPGCDTLNPLWRDSLNRPRVSYITGADMGRNQGRLIHPRAFSIALLALSVSLTPLGTTGSITVEYRRQ